MIGRIPQEVSAEIIKSTHFTGNHQSSSTPSLHQCIKGASVAAKNVSKNVSSTLFHYGSQRVAT